MWSIRYTEFCHLSPNSIFLFEYDRLLFHCTRTFVSTKSAMSPLCVFTRTVPIMNGNMCNVNCVKLLTCRHSHLTVRFDCLFTCLLIIISHSLLFCIFFFRFFSFASHWTSLRITRNSTPKIRMFCLIRRLNRCWRIASGRV